MFCAWQLTETDSCCLLCHQSCVCDSALSDQFVFFLFFFFHAKQYILFGQLNISCSEALSYKLAYFI